MRYLTPEEKRQELTRWRQLRQHAYSPMERGGQGWPDPQIFSLCDSLNALEGLCTLQSCSGHESPHPDKADIYLRSPAHLWLRLDKAMAKRFHEAAPSLAGEGPPIESVKILIMPDGREIIEIVFEGVERGKMDEAACVISSFFNRLARSGSGINQD